MARSKPSRGGPDSRRRASFFRVFVSIDFWRDARSECLGFSIRGTPEMSPSHFSGCKETEMPYRRKPSKHCDVKAIVVENRG